MTLTLWRLCGLLILCSSVAAKEGAFDWRSALASNVADLFTPPGENFWNNYQSALNFFRGTAGGGGGDREGHSQDTSSLEEALARDENLRESLLQALNDEEVRRRRQEEETEPPQQQTQFLIPEAEEEAGSEETEGGEAVAGRVTAVSPEEEVSQVSAEATTAGVPSRLPLRPLLDRERPLAQSVDSVVALLQGNLQEEEEETTTPAGGEESTTQEEEVDTSTPALRDAAAEAPTAPPAVRPTPRVALVVTPRPAVVFHHTPPKERQPEAGPGDTEVHSSANRLALGVVDLLNTMGVVGGVLSLPLLLPAVLGRRRRRSLQEESLGEVLRVLRPHRM